MNNTTMCVHNVQGWRQVSIFRRFCLLLLALGLAPPLWAAQPPELQSAEVIGQAVLDYLSAQNSRDTLVPHITIGNIDARLRLGRCDHPLETFSPPGQKTVGSTTVGVRCHRPVSWTLYVQANVALYQPVMVARRPMPRGTVLSSTDVELVEKDVARLTLGYITELRDVDGMVLKRSINAGAVLSPGLIQAPASIRRGERVTILGATGGVEVRMEGLALMDGAKGNLIRVRNLSSGREIEGVVTAPGIVQVRL